MVICPPDDEEARPCPRTTYDDPGPDYHRLRNDECPRIEGLHGRCAVEEIQVLRDGQDLLMVCTGPVTARVIEAADELHGRGVRSTVAVVACIAPAPVKALTSLLARFKSVLTVEEHYTTGGLGSLVSEVVADHNLGSHLRRCGVTGFVGGVTGSADYMRHIHGLSREAIVESALQHQAIRLRSVCE